MEYTKSVKYLVYSLPGTCLSIFFLILADSKLFELSLRLQGVSGGSTLGIFFSNPLVIVMHILVLLLLVIFFVAYLSSSNKESLSGLYLLVYSTILGIGMMVGYIAFLMILKSSRIV